MKRSFRLSKFNAHGLAPMGSPTARTVKTTSCVLTMVAIVVLDS